MMLKILGISGSPRKGATLFALETALEEAKRIPGIETEIWSVRGKKIGFCVHCDACVRDKVMCIIKDDLQELESKILEADAIIVASPVYDMNVSAQLQAVFNRLRPIYLVHPGKLQNKVGAAISTGGTRHGGQEIVNMNILNFFLMHEMLAFGGLGGCYNGGTVWTRDNKAQGVIDDEVGFDQVKRLGLGLAEAALAAKYGREKWLEMKAEYEKEFAIEKSPLRDH
jgi:multimeric flavodoxin WrbA